MNSIKAVIFDVGGVLHESNSAMHDALKASLGINDATLADIMSELIPPLGTGQITEADFWRQARNLHKIREVATSENLLGKAFAEQLVPHQETSKLVHELGAQGLKTAVLSNTIEPHARALREAGIYEPFNYVFLSHEIGYRKPDPDAFNYALQTLAIEPSEALLVDDDAQNIEAALQLGMQAVLFTTEAETVAAIRSAVNGFLIKGI